MKKIFSLRYIKRIGNWIWQGKFYILSILAGILTVLYVLGILNFYPNTVSLFMTIAGLLIIFRLLMLDAREFTDQRPNTPRNWIKSFPITRPINISVSDGILVTSSVRARAISTLSESATIEEEVEFLLSQVRSIQDSIENVNTQVESVESSLKKEIIDLKTNIRNLDTSLKAVIASHAVGTYDLNFFGIIITLCGTIIQYFSTKNF